MKFVFFFLLAILSIAVCSSCEKSTDPSALSIGISGRWQIITDSSYQGAGASNHLVAYQGKDGDYYDFGSDSLLTVKEGDTTFTYAYQITSDSTFSLFTPDDQFHTWPITYSIVDPTTHSLTLINAWMITPGGILGRAVYLHR